MNRIAADRVGARPARRVKDMRQNLLIKNEMNKKKSEIASWQFPTSFLLEIAAFSKQGHHL